MLKTKLIRIKTGYIRYRQKKVLRIFRKISSNNLIGYLNITKEDNPKIKDATNRQDFIDCEEYRELKEYIIEQIEALEKYLSNIKKKESLKTATKLIDANLQLNKISTIISEISGKTTPEVRNKLSEIKKKQKVYNVIYQKE